MLKKRRKRWLQLTVLAVLFVILAAYVPRFMHATSQSDYCASCHVMEPHYEDWFHSGAHHQVECVDCHLPNDNFVNHYVWKGINGIKDIVSFYSGMIPDPIKASDHGIKTIQGNCLRCHGEMVSQTAHTGRNCWECHRSNYHFMNHYRHKVR